MNAIFQEVADPQVEWLYHVRPTGLVIGPNVIREEELTPPRPTAVDSASVYDLLTDEADDGPALTDLWAFFNGILGWEARYVAGAPGGPELPPELAVRVPEHEVTLAPDWAVRELGEGRPFQVLVKLHLDVEADQRGALDGWEATPHQQFERLLRDTEVPIGVLVDRGHIRIVYAPRGETSGWLSFPIRSLATVAGRPMLAGLKLMLGHARLFTEPEHRRLPKLLARSREAQNEVSAKLAEQVLGALHELLRAFHTADRERIEQLTATDPHHLYEGLLTTLMRLVFLLYAEDRDLIPTIRSGEALDIYEQGYSVRNLYTRLAQDRALNPDTMDERVGGWGQLLALFRLVHGGHRSGWITPRGGKLFDPDVFPFLESRESGEPRSAARILPVRDGAILRILEGLMTLEARSISGEKVRERLSYRSLDVEQIGSVYETVMGFTVLKAPGPMIAVKGDKGLPVFVDTDALAQKKGTERQKLLKEWGVAPTGRRLEAIKQADGVDELRAALAQLADERASPGGHVTVPGSPVLQPTDERRRTGSHYTPRSLTEPIVRHALEPAFERIGEEATPDQVIEIKVCDPACGSGAFLVEACRQLGERLEKAWARHPQLKPAIPGDEDEALHARRLVAQRCLYGVDKNPMAVDLARLSLWLATLAREHEFTFLDHALKAGDSLVGLTRAQIEAAHWDTSKPGLPLLRGLVKERVSEVVSGRREIQFAPDDVQRAIQEARHRLVEKRLEQPRTFADAILAAFFSADKSRAREEKRQEVESLLTGMGSANWSTLYAIAGSLALGEQPIRPFHWEIEFPEVFERENPGFDGIFGNPPFLGATGISSGLGMIYFKYLTQSYPPAKHHCDLVGYFFRRCFALLRQKGALGLIATNTISQGDTRESALAPILSSDGSIYRVVRRYRWPGEAAVIISLIHIVRGRSERTAYIDDRPVTRVSAFLVEGTQDTSPFPLCDSLYFSLGCNVYGQGFLFDDNDPKASPHSERERITNSDPSSSARILPYLGGEDLVQNPRHQGERYVVQLSDVERFDELQKWPALLELVEKKVRPERMRLGDNPNNTPLKRRWWAYQAHRPELFSRLGRIERTICTPRISPHLTMTFVACGPVFNGKIVVIPYQEANVLGTLQSRVHELWARRFSSTLKDDLNYSASDCLRTFPLPRPPSSALELIGEEYYSHRVALMISRGEGLTKTYNRFHSPTEKAADVGRLRELHAEMDLAVLRAYGWHDLVDQAAPQFLTPETEDDHTYQGRLFWPSDFRDEVLARLLKLNAERHAEEVRLGLSKGGSARPPPDEAAEEELSDVAE